METLLEQHVPDLIDGHGQIEQRLALVVGAGPGDDLLGGFEQLLPRVRNGWFGHC